MAILIFDKYSLQNKPSIVEPLKLDHIESITRCVYSKQWSMSLRNKVQLLLHELLLKNAIYPTVSLREPDFKS